MSGTPSSQAPNINTTLPDEMLARIFLHLAARHLPRVAEVCTRWQQVLDTPGFWSWVVFRVSRSNLASMPERLDCRRLQGVRKLEVEAGWQNGACGVAWRVEVSEKLLQAVAGHPGLRELDMSGTDLSRVEPELLASTLSKMEEVNLWYTELTPRQASIFCQVLKDNTHLKSLQLGDVDLSRVEPELLAGAVAKLEEVNLSNTSLTNLQARALCQVLKENSHLKMMDLRGNKLSGVEAGLMEDSRLIIDCFGDDYDRLW